MNMTYQVPRIVPPPPPLPSSKNIPLVTQAIVIIITVSVIFINFVLGY